MQIFAETKSWMNLHVNRSAKKLQQFSLHNVQIPLKHQIFHTSHKQSRDCGRRESIIRTKRKENLPPAKWKPPTATKQNGPASWQQSSLRLFGQQLCDHHTSVHFFDSRPFVDQARIWRLFVLGQMWVLRLHLSQKGSVESSCSKCALQREALWMLPMRCCFWSQRQDEATHGHRA